jgi:hypothetical protein
LCPLFDGTREGPQRSMWMTCKGCTTCDVERENEKLWDFSLLQSVQKENSKLDAVIDLFLHRELMMEE